MPDQEINYTQLLEEEYGQIAGSLIPELREDLKMSDEEIYKFLESFF